jgi:hypothetical protein
LLDTLQEDAQPRLLTKSGVNRLGKAKRLDRFTLAPGLWSRRRSSRRTRQLGFVGVRLVHGFGLSEPDLASAGDVLDDLPGCREFLVYGAVHRREYSLGEAPLVTVPFVAATERKGEQEESEKP